VKAYSKLMGEMWNMANHSVAPTLFKRILGEYAPTFAGYGQHDSHECIGAILDLMGEDLYRKGKKPYVEIDEKPNQPEEEVAQEAWHKHLVRNESIITDLFHGQFKSTVQCSQCERISITFDPMTSLMVPIPTPKQKREFFFIPFNVSENYIN
jgi:ubiquitin C-terminal hydrolase